MIDKTFAGIKVPGQVGAQFLHQEPCGKRDWGHAPLKLGRHMFVSARVGGDDYQRAAFGIDKMSWSAIVLQIYSHHLYRNMS